MKPANPLSKLLVIPDQGETAYCWAMRGEIVDAYRLQRDQFMQGWMAAGQDEPYRDFAPAAWQLGWIECSDVIETGPGMPDIGPRDYVMTA